MRDSKVFSPTFRLSPQDPQLIHIALPSLPLFLSLSLSLSLSLCRSASNQVLPRVTLPLQTSPSLTHHTTACAFAKELPVITHRVSCLTVAAHWFGNPLPRYESVLDSRRPTGGPNRMIGCPFAGFHVDVSQATSYLRAPVFVNRRGSSRRACSNTPDEG